MPLGIDGVKGERRFARPRQPRENHEFVARDGDIDIFEIVDAHTAQGKISWHSVISVNDELRRAYAAAKRINPMVLMARLAQRCTSHEG